MMKIRLAMGDPDGEVSAETEETALSSGSAARASDPSFKALIAHLRQAHPDVDIDAWLAQAGLANAKPGRFNPDAILAEFAPELACGEPIPETEEEEILETPLPVLPAPELLGEVLPQGLAENSAESAAPNGDVLLDAETLLPEAGSEEIFPDLPTLPEGTELASAAEGENALPELPALDMIPQDGEIPSAEAEAVSVEIDPSASQNSQMSEILPETPTKGDEAVSIAEEAGEIIAEATKTAKASDEEKPSDTAAAHPDDAQSLEELLEQYRRERESQSGRERDTSPFSRQNAQKDRRDAANATAVKRSQGTEPANASQPRDTRADVPREVPLSPATGMDFKEILEAPLPAQSARAGVAYTLDRTSAFSDGINTVLEFMRTDGTSEARIVVEPPALGHIDVSLRATSVGMEATFRVDNEHLKQMLQQQMDVLKSSLQLQGIHVSSLAVDIRNRDDQRGRETAYASGKRSRRVGGTDGLEEGMDEGASLVRLDLEKGLLHWVG